MSETEQGTEGLPPGEGGRPVPHRVVGTPPPALARELLSDPSTDGVPITPSANGGAHSHDVAWDLPAEVEDPPRAKRMERVVAALFGLSLLASVAFIAAYVGIQVNSVDGTLRSNLALGTSMGVAFLAMGAAFTLWVRHLMPQVELTEERKPLASPANARAEFERTFLGGAAASGFLSRPLLRRSLIASTLPLAAAPLVLLRDMGPLPGTSLRRTVWRKGMRLLTYGPNTPILAADFSQPGEMITVIPEGYEDNQIELSKATAIIIKFAPGVLQPPTVMNWTVDGIVAYSKICTHVGCPVALYEQTTHHILCPCHQSTFDATRGATVLFGPAPRPLPQLPMATDSQGYLVAREDYVVPVGPSFWELGPSGFKGGNE